MQLSTMKRFILLVFIASTSLTSCSQSRPIAASGHSLIQPGAERIAVYLPLLKIKIAVFANQTSMVGNTHLVDTLLANDIKIIKIFGPEHGFRVLQMQAKKWETILIKTDPDHQPVWKS